MKQKKQAPHLSLVKNAPTEKPTWIPPLNVEEISSRLDLLWQQINHYFLRIEKKLDDKSVVQRHEEITQEIKNLKSLLAKQTHDNTLPIIEKKPHTHNTILNGVQSLIKKVIQKIPFLGRPLLNAEELSLEKSFDPFGRDPEFEQKLKPFFDFMYYRYWRISTHGLENIPSDGRALLVGNHSGTLPWDGSMLRVAVSNDHPSQRDVRFLVEDFVYYLPFVGTYMYRVGGVRASRDNAERLLESDHLVAVFPEGVKGIGKHYSKRYHLQRFGRGGFIKLALKTNSPIIPVGIIGAEEIHPIIYKSSFLAKPLGIPYIPITPTLPWLGPLGFIPLPSKWSIFFGEPIDLSKYGKKALKDELLIHQLSEMVRQNIQKMITEELKKRRSVWTG